MQHTSNSPEETFNLGRELGAGLGAGDVVLLYGGLGAGKTLLTKGILDALDYDVDEVTSPSYSLVNLYKTENFKVYHIDLWRVEEGHDPVTSVGLDEILEPDDSLVIIEWADKLAGFDVDGRVFKVAIEGDGEQPRTIVVADQIDPEHYTIVVRKAERKLDLSRGDVLIGTYDIALGFTPEGQKEREGDGRTPEGDFYVFAQNPRSNHHLSLAISYPDAAAAARGLEDEVVDRDTYDHIMNDLQNRNWVPQETPLGGRIYIHGGGTESDWTDGCIALKDKDIEEIFELAGVGTKVAIQP